MKRSLFTRIRDWKRGYTDDDIECLSQKLEYGTSFYDHAKSAWHFWDVTQAERNITNDWAEQGWHGRH